MKLYVLVGTGTVVQYRTYYDSDTEAIFHCRMYIGISLFFVCSERFLPNVQSRKCYYF
jgi:hypothetical protein